MSTLHALLAERFHRSPNALAYKFLTSSGPQDRTWAELYARAGGYAAALRDAGVQPGDRALLLFHEGLDYLDALYGCMRAGVLAVPAHPPDPRRLDRTLPRVHALLRDATPTALLATADVHDLTRTDALLDGLIRISPPEPSHFEDVSDAPLAYLQYTSGSTADPKGVQVSHGNLLHQLRDFDQGYDHGPDSTLVSWIPATHDLGLVYGRFMGLYKSIPTVFFSPADFMARPRLWLEALTEHRGTHSPSPNFGFEYAARRVTDLSGLDLSGVRVLLNGAEPIRARSEAAFIERFAPAGLRPTALTHAMGMSEATAKIVTEPIARTARFLSVDPAALTDNRVVLDPAGVQVASNGSTQLDTVVLIADPDRCEDLGEDQIGELWVGGTTVAQGYHNRPEETERVFRAHTADGRGPFLRTGDLGFLHEGELYLVGRHKDLLIFRGQNHHPQDIEWAFDGAHPALRPNGSAAFSTQGPDGEQLAIIAEVRPPLDSPQPVFSAIRARLSELGLAPAHIALIPPGALPKTSSGKIRRREARRRFETGELAVLHRQDRSRHQPIALSPSDPRTLLLQTTAALLGLDPSDLDSDQPFKELGIDSVTAVELVASVGETLGRDIPATWLWDHPTIDALAAALSPKPSVITGDSTDIDAMTEAEAEAALLAELEGL